MIETNIEHRLESFRALAASALETPSDPLSEALTRLLSSLLITSSPPTHAASPSIDPVQANGFRFEEIVGRGGMGTVYRAWDESLNRHIAVKVLGFVAEPQQYEQFQREAQAAATIRSDFVVPIYSTGLTHDRRPYLVMPLIRGQTLRDRLQTGPLAPKALAKILREVAEGTHALHTAGLLHRDIKPANILLDDDDHRAKLTDFGLARTQATTGLTLDGVFAGTPEYMAPEQALGAHSLDARTDVYSLGVTLFEGLTGQLPLQGTPFEILRQRCTTEAVSPRSLNRTVPRDLATICLMATATEPSQRYTTAAAFADDLNRWSQGLPITARPRNALERTAHWMKRNPVVVGVLICFLTGALIASLGWMRAVSNARLAEERRAAAEQSAIAESAQRVRAEQHLETSRYAIEKFRSRIMTPAFLNEPKYEGIRQELLTDAATIYERLLEIESSDDRLHRAAITTAHQLGLLQSNLGRFDGAEATLRRSIEFARVVVAQNPNDAETKHLLLLSLNTLHVVLGKNHQLEKASEVDLESIAICQELLHRKPDDLMLRRNLASLKANRASSAIVRGDKAIARNDLLEARTHFEELIRIEPNDLTFQIDLTRIDFNLGLASETTVERVRHYNLALVARRKLIVLEPRRSYFVNEYVKNCLYLAAEYSAMNDWSVAEKLTVEGIVEARTQLKLATDAALQLMLCDLLNSAAICALNLNKAIEAEVLYRDAMEIYQSLGTIDESRYWESALDLAINYLTYLKDQKRQHSAEADAVRTVAQGWLDGAKKRAKTNTSERAQIVKWQDRLDSLKPES